MNSGYRFKVMNPTMSNDIPQMKSAAFQNPFYFGGSQVGLNLGLKPVKGSGFVGDTPPKYNDGAKFHILKTPLR